MANQFLFLKLFGQEHTADLTQRDLHSPLSYTVQPVLTSQKTNNRRVSELNLKRQKFKAYPDYLPTKGYNQQSYADLLDNIVRVSKRFPPTFPRKLSYFKDNPVVRDAGYLTERYSPGSSLNLQNLSDAKEFIVRLFCALHSDNGHASELRMRICQNNDLDAVKYWKQQCFKDHSNSYENYSSCLLFLLPAHQFKKRAAAVLKVLPSATKTKDGFWKRFIKDAEDQSLKLGLRMIRF